MAFLMSAEAIRSSIALAASAGNSASDAKRRAINWRSVNSPSGALGFRQESGQSQPFFQADDAVLHLQRVDAVQGYIDHEQKRTQDKPVRKPITVLNGIPYSSHKHDNGNGSQKKVKYRIEPGVIAQSLRLSFSHLPQYVMPPGRLVLGARFSRVSFRHHGCRITCAENKRLYSSLCVFIRGQELF